MLMLLALVGLVVWLGVKFGESVGIIALAVLIVFLLIVGISASKEESKAHGNWVRYWAKGGPEQYRKKRNGANNSNGRNKRRRY